MSRLGLLVILMLGRAAGFDPTTLKMDTHERNILLLRERLHFSVTDIQYINT
jgi:hypothetical protein